MPSFQTHPEEQTTATSACVRDAAPPAPSRARSRPVARTIAEDMFLQWEQEAASPRQDAGREPAEPPTVESLLYRAESSSRRHRVRLTTAIVGFGVVLLLIACVGWVRFFGWLPRSAGVVGTWWLGGGPCFGVMLLGVLPTDIKPVGAVTAVFLIAYALFAIMCFLASAVFMKSDCANEGSRCFSGASCLIWSVALAFGGVANAALAITLSRTLGTKMPTRIKLSTLWFTLRLFYIGCGGLLFTSMTAISVRDAALRTSAIVQGYFVCGCGWISFGLVATPHNRRMAMSLLHRVGAHTDVAAAATVASLLGGVSTRETLSLAKRSFRCISMETLVAGDFDSNATTSPSGPGRSLIEHTTASDFGGVDAFISHSWSDPGDEKWTALQQWRAQFEREHGRAPLVWLDKACIDQLRIAESLACLPVFLGGCRELIVLLGPSYPSRLWCIMELFTFLKMGGGPARMKLLPLATAVDMCEFDVESASCFLDEDRQRLLSVIEVGFGDFSSFNTAIRKTFSAVRSAQGEAGRKDR